MTPRSHLSQPAVVAIGGSKSFHLFLCSFFYFLVCILEKKIFLINEKVHERNIFRHLWMKEWGRDGNFRGRGGGGGGNWIGFCIFLLHFFPSFFIDGSIYTRSIVLVVLAVRRSGCFGLELNKYKQGSRFVVMLFLFHVIMVVVQILFIVIWFWLYIIYIFSFK